MTRRELLKFAAGLPLVLTIPQRFRASFAAEPRGSNRLGRWDRILILIELNGGNDGLNTVIPYADERYYHLRPRLAVPRGQTLQLSPRLGFHPALERLMPLWQAQELAVVLGVGYARPNRSHFRSIEICETGSDSERVLEEGWLARLFRQYPPPADFTADGILLGRRDAGPLSGSTTRTIALENPDHFLKQATAMQITQTTTLNKALAHILQVQRELSHASIGLQERLQRAPALQPAFPATPIGRQLETAARLLAAKVPVAAIKVSHGSFDTHAGQLGHHQRLLQELAEALAVFTDAVRRMSLWDRMLIMTYSEFGRRAGENGSGGTDHGTAAPQLLVGGKVKGGFYGAQPSLTDLLDGDLRYHVDYRDLYATVITNWWDLPAGIFGPHEATALNCLA